MRNVRLLISMLVLAAVSAVTVAAQAQPAGKVGLIDLLALGESGGATRYVNALASLEKEFETEIRALQTMSTDIQNKTQELQTLAEQANKPNSPIGNDTLRKKSDELERVKREFTFKQEDLQARITSRRQTVVGPIFSDMRVALREFAIQKGYAVILDGAKLEEAGLLMAFDIKYDVTKEFVTFYNARPAGAASTNR